jgi:hypothetical protein
MPFVTDLVKIGVTDAAEENFDLHIAFDWIASRDGGGSQRRFRAGSRVGFGLVRVHNLMLLLIS